MITRIYRLLVVCIISFSVIISSDETSSKTIAWHLKTPVYLRENASIFCIIQEDEKPGHMAWTKAGQLIVLNNASLYSTKYDVIVNYHKKSTRYTLVIKNINMGDLNIVYKCESGFSSAEGILPLNEETFVAKPQNQDVTRNFSLKGGYLKAFVEMSSVYPKPRCVAVFKDKDITRYSDTNYTKDLFLYSMQFDLVYQTNECGKINILCVIGKEKSRFFPISHEFNKDCGHSNTDRRNLSESEVVGIIAGVVILVAVAVALALFVFCCWRRTPRNPITEAESNPLIELKTNLSTTEAINQLPMGDKIRYKQLLLSSETEKRYFVRIMIVGKESVGKTCLLRRLLKEDISDVTSTDGVDIVVRRCKINIEDGKWMIGKDI